MYSIQTDGQTMMTTAQYEEIECFRMPSGGFSQDKRYEYTYATRKSWEYIPALGRKDWRYFTNKGFTYAGKWVRSEQRGWGGWRGLLGGVYGRPGDDNNDERTHGVVGL